jgi:hypothetical protein
MACYMLYELKESIDLPIFASGSSERVEVLCNSIFPMHKISGNDYGKKGVV